MVLGRLPFAFKLLCLVVVDLDVYVTAVCFFFRKKSEAAYCAKKDPHCEDDSELDQAFQELVGCDHEDETEHQSEEYHVLLSTILKERVHHTAQDTMSRLLGSVFIILVIFIMSSCGDI